MAKQIGTVQLQGSIGNISFVKGKNGNFARQRPASREIKNDRIKENMSEFSSAAKAGKQLRTAFATPIADIQDGKIVSRVTQVMSTIQKTDMESPRGSRLVSNGDITILQGFEFNGAKALSTVLKVKLAASIDRETGDMEIIIPELNPQKLICKPEAATHYVLTATGAMVNFFNGDYLVNNAQSTNLPLANASNPELKLELQMPAPDADNPLLLALGISFLQEVNGEFKPVGEKQYNALALVAVASPVS